MARRLYHGGQIVFYLLLSAARKQGYDGLLRQVVAIEEVGGRLMKLRLEVAHLLCCRVANIVYLVVMLTLIERYFERKDGEHLINISFNGLNAPLFPCPYLGRDVIIHWYLRVLMHVFGYSEVKSGVVYQYHHVGLPLQNVGLAQAHTLEDGGQMHQYGHEAHVGQLAIMLHARASYGTHQVAPEESELGRRVFLQQGFHQS